jgi:hypothetical protein
MIELLAHLWGDYVLQNHWMANTKTKRTWPAFVHAFCYTLPFLFLTWSWKALLVIGVTHFLIDRLRLPKYWVNFWGSGVVGWLPEQVLTRSGWSWITKHGGDFKPMTMLIKNFPSEVELELADAPPWLGVWLFIIIDNTFHLTINHLALAYL